MNASTGFALVLGLTLTAWACRDPGDPVVPPPPPPPSQSLTVNNVTTGGEFDVDGFVILLDGSPSAALDLNSDLRFDGISAGEHTVALDGIAANCSVSESNRTVVIAPGEQAAVEFRVSCVPSPELAAIRIIFARDGDGPYRTSSLFAMNADGSGRVQLTKGGYHSEPDVSPDATRIAFEARNDENAYNEPDIHVTNADGTGISRLVATTAYSPDWSPDGRFIAFGRGGGLWGGPIHVIGAEGAGEVTLTSTDPFTDNGWPAWSPDGSRIAFTRAESDGLGPISIWTMAADGSGAAPLTRSLISDVTGPVWSPDGSSIAFETGRWRPSAGWIHIVDLSGPVLRTVLESDRAVVPHDWSADGELILFTRQTESGATSRSDIFLLRLQDQSILRLTADGHHHSPKFWPGSGTIPGLLP